MRGFLSVLPDDYDVSPKYDDDGLDDPAGTVMELTVDDRVDLTVDGWSQSLSTPRGQTRDTISDDDEWTAAGVVASVGDSRDDPFASDWKQREVHIHARTSLTQRRNNGDSTPTEIRPLGEARNGFTRPPLADADGLRQRWVRPGDDHRHQLDAVV